MNSPKKDRYHHGNLKQDLLTTALDALERDGLEKLSLRSLAKALGVTPTAVYGHFSDKIALLIDLRTLGFQQLGEAIRDALSALPPECSAEDKIRKLGKAYMHFAVSTPHLFDVLFSWTPDFARITPECAQQGCSGEKIVRDTIIELLQEQGIELNEYQAAVASFSTWSLVHGISTLLKSGSVEGAIHCEHWPASFSAAHPESQSKILDHLLTIQIEGIKAAATACQQ